ncbi:MAG: ATP-binding cassette domain-containing protein [Bacillota bacterium]|jgi:energy-coupling factor transport system ATP-binding protein
MSLTVKNLCYTYADDTDFAVHAVNDVSFTAADGEVIGIVGHTGSGKSSLAQLICGLLPGDSGEIHLGDYQLVGQKKLKAKELAKRIGMVFQYPEYQLFEETVWAELAYGPTNLGWQEAEINDEIVKLMKSLNMDDEFLDRNPLQLSGGEKRKVALASVLIMNPQILVLDEPFVGLDCVSKNEFTEMLLSWQQTNNATILCISHDMDQLAVFCQRLLVMNHGRLVLDKPIKEAFAEREILKEAGILQPVPKEMLLNMADLGCEIDTLPINITEACKAVLSYLKKAGERHG